MVDKKNIVEETLIQVNNLENMLQENAKEILSSTMSKEINELVKESLMTKNEESDMDEVDFETDLSEQMDDDEMVDDEVEDVEIDNIDIDDDNQEVDDIEMSSDVEADSEDIDAEFDDSEEFNMPDMDDEPIDLTNASDEEILKVFKAMGNEDGIIVTKEDDEIHLKDDNDDVEYRITIDESDEDDFDEMSEEMENEYMNNFEDMDDMDMDMDDMEMEDMEMDEMDEMDDMDEMSEMDEMDDMDDMDEMDEMEDMEDMEDMEMSEMDEMEDDEVVFEIVMDDEEDFDFDDEEITTEAFKPKGVGMGKPSFKFKKSSGGFKENMKHANSKMGTGKPKFEFKESDAPAKPKIKPTTKPTTKPKPKHPFKPDPDKAGKPKAEKAETKEASRTLKSGKFWGKPGLSKPRSAPRSLKVESNDEELVLLRQKNEEYRKALNIFREKLNEVAVFNSNLAYATRLFTEHSTTKQEKINILRRFDNIESIKESKNLYKTIKSELGNENKNIVKESFDKIDNVQKTGSSEHLIENKVHENNQFTRIKDLMSKINK
jgi:hypothetical protein